MGRPAGQVGGAERRVADEPLGSPIDPDARSGWPAADIRSRAWRRDADDRCAGDEIAVAVDGPPTRPCAVCCASMRSNGRVSMATVSQISGAAPPRDSDGRARRAADRCRRRCRQSSSGPSRCRPADRNRLLPILAPSGSRRSNSTRQLATSTTDRDPAALDAPDQLKPVIDHLQVAAGERPRRGHGVEQPERALKGAVGLDEHPLRLASASASTALRCSRASKANWMPRKMSKGRITAAAIMNGARPTACPLAPLPFDRRGGRPRAHLRTGARSGAATADQRPPLAFAARARTSRPANVRHAPRHQPCRRAIR